MRILYDGNIYALQPAGGITRYFGSLISRLPADFEPSLVVRHAVNSNYPSHPNLKVYQYDRLRPIPISYRLSLYYSRVRGRLLRAAVEHKHFDVFHPTYYNLLDGGSIASYRHPMVITVWDMIHELFPEQLDPSGKHAEEKRRAIMAAQAIICISENTRKDLLERHPSVRDKVRVIHLASELNPGLSFGPEPVPARPYFLFVGSRAWYKNFDGLLTAFAKLVSKLPDVALCIVGGPLEDSENKRITDLGLSDRIEYCGYPSDEHLAKLYRSSLALVYPSLSEGFGLPPLEAMACGTVAVVCRTSSIPEVVGDAGVYFDPDSQDDLSDILYSLARDETLRKNLILKGNEQAGNFSWDMTVAQTVEVYRTAAGE